MTTTTNTCRRGWTQEEQEDAARANKDRSRYGRFFAPELLRYFLDRFDVGDRVMVLHRWRWHLGTVEKVAISKIHVNYTTPDSQTVHTRVGPAQVYHLFARTLGY